MEVEQRLDHKDKYLLVSTCCNWQIAACIQCGPYPGIAPGGCSIHYTNTNHNPYLGANPG